MDTVEKTVETDTTKLDTIVNSENPTTLSASNGTNENDDEAKVPPLTKRQQRKIRKMAKFEITKKLKRQHERIRAKEKRAQEAALGLPGRTTQRKALKRNTIENSKNPVRVAIDLDYDDQMIDKDISKCSKQLLLVYTLNRKSEMPINLFYTSLRSDSRIGKTVSRNDGYVNWDIKFKEESYTEVFDKESIVYLSSDSETVLDQLDPNAVYIIGGLVDHNHHKGMSLERAEKHGFKTARLPLGEHVCLKTRTVLTIVHVFDIILRVSQGQGWEEAILAVLPPRKLRTEGRKRKGKPLTADTEQDQTGEEEQGDSINSGTCSSETLEHADKNIEIGTE